MTTDPGLGRRRKPRGKGLPPAGTGQPDLTRSGQPTGSVLIGSKLAPPTPAGFVLPRDQLPAWLGERHPEDAALVIVARHIVRHPQRRRQRIGGKGNSRDQATGEQDPKPYLPLEHQPGSEPPDGSGQGQGHYDECGYRHAVPQDVARATQQRHVDEECRHPGDPPDVVAGRLPPGGSAPGAEVGAPERGREGAGVEDRQDQAEQAGGPADVLCGGERLLDRDQRSAGDAEAMSQRSEDGHAQVRGHEGGHDDDEREERDERLARQGDAAVDELRFEHPIPYFPQQRLLSPAADGLGTPPDLLKRVSAGRFGARFGHDPVLGFDRRRALAGYAGIRPWRVLLTGAVCLAAERGSPRRYPTTSLMGASRAGETDCPHDRKGSGSGA